MIVLGNGEFIGGFKVSIVSGWFVVWFLGIEDIYKIYVESFCNEVYFC